MRRVLITGAAGEIGRVLRHGLAGRYELLRLLDIAPLGAAGQGEECVQADIGDMAALEAAMDGIDVIVHLAGFPRENTWETILTLNIAGTYNVFEAARRRGVPRVVFASSNHAVGFYRLDGPLDLDLMPRPDSRYGVSKVFGEAVGRLYADKHGLSVACLRIGSFRPRPGSVRELSTWISHRDTVHLVERCIAAPSYHFIAIYGVSANTRSRWDNSKVAFLGFAPQDNAEVFAAELLAKQGPIGPVEAAFHGGPTCQDEYDGDPSRID